MQLSNDELVHIASFLPGKDFRSFRNCNNRTRSLVYHPIRYYISGMNYKCSIKFTINKCLLLSIITLVSYSILATLIVGISLLTSNNDLDHAINIVGYICLIATGVMLTSLILFILRVTKINRNRIPIISSTSGNIMDGYYVDINS